MGFYLNIWFTHNSCQGCQIRGFPFTRHYLRRTPHPIIAEALLLLMRNKFSALKFCPFCHTIQTINVVFMLLNLLWQVAVATVVQAACASIISFCLLLVLAQNKHEGTSEVAERKKSCLLLIIYVCLNKSNMKTSFYDVQLSFRLKCFSFCLSMIIISVYYNSSFLIV